MTSNLLDINTKQKIFFMGEKLFYEYGYHATKISDICKRLDITKGAFYHHYKNKLELGSLVYLNFAENNRRTIDYFDFDENDAAMSLCLETKTFWYLFFTDQKIRRFSTEMSNENIIEIRDISLLDKLPRQFNKQLNNVELSYIAAAHVGMVRQITMEMNTRIKQYNYNELSNYYLKAFFKFLRVDDSLISRLIHDAELVFSKCTIDHKYFNVFVHIN